MCKFKVWKNLILAWIKILELKYGLFRKFHKPKIAGLKLYKFKHSKAKVMLNYFLMVYSLELMTCKVASYKMLVYICDIEVTTNTYYQPQHKGYESREVNFLLKMFLLRKKYFSKTCFLGRETLCIEMRFYVDISRKKQIW